MKMINFQKLIILTLVKRRDQVHEKWTHVLVPYDLQFVLIFIEKLFFVSQLYRVWHKKHITSTALYIGQWLLLHFVCVCVFVSILYCLIFSVYHFILLWLNKIWMHFVQTFIYISSIRIYTIFLFVFFFHLKYWRLILKLYALLRLTNIFMLPTR